MITSYYVSLNEIITDEMLENTILSIILKLKDVPIYIQKNDTTFLFIGYLSSYNFDTHTIQIRGEHHSFPMITTISYIKVIPKFDFNTSDIERY